MRTASIPRELFVSCPTVGDGVRCEVVSVAGKTKKVYAERVETMGEENDDDPVLAFIDGWLDALAR